MASIPDDEWQRYVDEHEAIHGHKPIRDLLKGTLCSHPSHDEARRIIDGDGVDILMAFDPHDLIADDDPRILKFQEDYERAVHANKLWIQEMEDEDRQLRRTHCTIGDHDVRQKTIMGQKFNYCRREGCTWIVKA